MGSGDVLKLGYIARNQSKIIDAKIELFTTLGQGARPIAEDIIAYCQIRLSECTKNDFIDIVKRNITNLFEDVEDPFADSADFDDSPSGSAMLSQNRGKNNKIASIMGGGMRSKLGNAILDRRRSLLGGDVEFF
jgi:hypothetical protein